MAPQRAETNPEGILLENRLHKETSHKEEIHLETTLGNPSTDFFSKLKTRLKSRVFFINKR
jgi:hypothetical protein